MSPASSQRGSRRRSLGLALASAGLLTLAFPPFSQPWSAWIGCLPWLLLLRKASARAAFWWSALIGFAFFLASIWWLTYVTIFGWVLLCTYLALYFGLFGVIARITLARSPRVYIPLVLGAAWVALEFLRNWVFSGFGWNLLAYSQTPWVPVLQIADVTGAWGVSFLIIWVNAWLLLLIEARRGVEGRVRHPRERLRRDVVIALAVPVVVLAYGAWRIRALDRTPTARIAVVQGNIPQHEKWDESNKGRILTQYEELTRQAAEQHPDLIIWPETSVPGYLWADEELTQRVIGITQAVKTPLLVGAPMLRVRPGSMLLTNSASLVGADGAAAGRYDKTHLVAYGEFIPFERLLPWLRKLLPPIGDFVPGHEYTVFTNSQLSTPNSQLKFSVLICFEDLFPGLARAFVREGAQFLVVITNDAWFGPTAAAYQHAQASTLRAVELRVPVVRAANTGWSGCIDAAGRWTGSVHDAGKELFVTGMQVCDVTPGPGISLYRWFGDWFVGLCVLILAGCVATRFFASTETHR